MLKRSLNSAWCIVVMLAMALAAKAQMPDPPGQVAAGETPKYEAYLFAHMMHADYGKLYYSVSLDGLHWEALNGGKRVFNEYRGHASICKGPDDRYYLVGNRNDSAPDINFWVSDDLIHWKKYSDLTPDLKHVPDYPKALARIGAPKVFYDAPSSQYVVSWHTPHDLGETNVAEPYWASQRTLYVTSKDLKTFSEPPRKFFNWDMGTIDVILRKEGDSYFAIIKDERYPTLDWTTGKTVRIAKASSLMGPYSEPGVSISPNFREAPTLIPSPNGKAWYLYYEQYPGVAYGLSVASSLEGPWFQVAGNQQPSWDKYYLPPKVRHGSMLPITRKEYDALVKNYGKEPSQATGQ